MSPPTNFEFDVFLSYSSKDKEVVLPLAERLRADGLRVWFDEWLLKSVDSISTKTEEGLEHSRALVFCMSANAFGSDWAQLEAGTFRFRDPLNKERRFIPLRLDGAPIEGTLAPFLYITWLPEDREQAYAKLLEACRPPRRMSGDAQATREQSVERVIQLGYDSLIYAYALSPHGKRAVSGAADRTVRLWDLETGRCLRVLKGHTGRVLSVAWSADQQRVISGSSDNTVRLWDVKTGRCLRVLTGHTESVLSVAWSADQSRAISGSGDKTIRLWEVGTGRCLRVLEGHTGDLHCVALTWIIHGSRPK